MGYIEFRGIGGDYLIVGVLVEISNKNVDKIFEYKVPDNLTSNIKIGIRVLVPFGRMTLEGFVLEIKKYMSDKDIYFNNYSLNSTL